MEYGLGRFGDRRLEKGGRFCIAVWLRLVSAVSRCAVWAATERARCGSRGFCAMRK